MSKRLILCAFATLAIALISLPVLQAQSSIVIERDRSLPQRPAAISSYDDDPFVADSVVEGLSTSRLDRSQDGRYILINNLINTEAQAVIYVSEQEAGEYVPFAWNPWAPELRMANVDGNFMFPDEERFPLHRVERGPDGKIILKEGLQLWLPQNLHRGMTTAFEAANAVKNAAEFWSERSLVWGTDGRLDINSHAFIDFNAFYSPTARSLYFGVVPHRLPGQTEIKMFELATSWEIAAHEAGHALHRAIKPNADVLHLGYQSWSESFGDQMEMWTSLRDRDRALRLLAEANGDLNRSNALTRIGEALGAMTGEDVSLRDAFHDKKISDTSEEEHARSEVFTGAAYKIFLTIYGGLRAELGDEGALRKAGEIMGIFLTRANDYMPENQMTLEDVAKAYLKVDKEFFEYRYHAALVDEFTRREIFDALSVPAWWAHEAATPQLWLPPKWPDHKIEQLIQANLEKLGIGTDFGLKLQNVTRSNQLVRGMGPQQAIVRVQLTQGRDDSATPLDNHGVLVFRASGMLADYHAPLPPDNHPSPLPDAFSQAQAMSMIGQANQLRIAQSGAPLAIVRRPDGLLTVEARIMRGAGLKPYMEVFTLDNPLGERREIVIPTLPPDKRIRISGDLLK